MRIYKIIMTMAVGALILTPCAFSQDQQKEKKCMSEAPEKPFFGMNKGLRRIGLDEIRCMATADIEMEKLYSGYRLDCGDRLKVQLWGKLEADFDLFIDKIGNMMIPSVGRVDVKGLTLEEAQLAIKKAVDIKYTNVEVEVSLANIPSILVKVTGHVMKPGMYLISPATSIPGIMAKAGGPNNWGSLSDIRLIRDGKNIASFNMYDFLLSPSPLEGQIMMNNDYIYVPEIKNIIAIRGDVKYPGLYDTMANMPLSKAIGMAGGLVPDGKSKVKVLLLRLNSQTKTVDVAKEVIFDFSRGIEPKEDLPLENYDTIVVTYALDYIPRPYRLFEKAKIGGEVRSPGEYLLNDKETLNSLIKRAGGLTDHAFVGGAVFTKDSLVKKQDSMLDDLVKTQKKAILEEEVRFMEALALGQDERRLRQRVLRDRREVLKIMESRRSNGRVVIDLEAIMNGKADLFLENGDSIEIPAIPDWVLVTGAVRNPGAIIFSEGKDLDFYMSGISLNGAADKDEIYIIKPNGYAKTKASGYGTISRGDIIVVPEKA